MAKLNKVRKFFSEESKSLAESGRKGFSGTEVCDCEGKVIYYPMRTSERGVYGKCEKCGREYMDHSGKHRNLPPSERCGTEPLDKRLSLSV